MTEATTLFISRAGADAAFASEIGRMLEDSGYSVILQQWDFANRNFVERMHATLAAGARVVALLSPEYLRSDNCAAEWQNAIADDPLNKNGRLVLLRVVECEPVGLLAGLAYWDLVPIRDDQSLLKDIVCNAVRSDQRPAMPTAGAYWRAPRTILDADAIRRVPSFTGREDELAAIATALARANGVAAVHGLGGMGKSSIAREFAWRNRDTYSVVWWINAQTEDGIIDGLLRMGSLLVRGLDQMRDRRAAAQQVAHSLLAGFAKPVLLIFDNLEDERLLSSWRPRARTQTLVTSRNASWSAEIAPIALNPWTLEDAARYLQHESKRTDLTNDVAHAIVDSLGGLPLAVAHAAAYLRATRMATPQRYLERITQHLADVPRAAEYPRSVSATFTEAIGAAEQEAAGAAAMLALAAWFAPDAIPDELFRQPIEALPEVHPLLPGAASALDLRTTLSTDGSADAALGALDRLSLLAFAPASRTYTIHRLVQLAARDLAGNESRAWIECAIDLANGAFPEVKFEQWLACERLLPHARAVLSNLPDETTLLPAADLALRCAEYLRERAAYAEAESLAALALSIREKALGPEHPAVAESLNDLADAYWYQGRYGEAEPLHARALEIREKVFGPEHLAVAESLNELAVAYERQGRYSEAVSLTARALAIREKAFGAEHHMVAESLNDLALLYSRLARYDEAEVVHLRALAVLEKILGLEHPDVAVSVSNLAMVHLHRGRYSEAEPLHARALAIREKALGAEHPDVAMSLSNLAFTYAYQGRYGEAEQMQARALAISENALGPSHPQVATCLDRLADVYVHQARYGEAEALHRRALAMFEERFGRSHPWVARSLSRLAVAYERQGRDDEAEQLYMQAEAISAQTLGAEHPTTKATRESLAALQARRTQGNQL